jgi:4-amino-4-deoxy-L-arabinose transferase-like glycosyltransferase
MKRKPVPEAVLLVLLCCIHCAVALYYKYGCGIDAEANLGGPGVWDMCWQMLPSDIMRHHFLQGLWYLHAQPPLYNMLGGLGFKLLQPHHLAAQQWLNIGLGSLAAAMTYPICKEIFRNRWAAFCTALFCALSPAIFLYEANVLYDFLTFFLITLSGWCLVRYCRKQTMGALIVFCTGINALILERSLYHVVLLVPLAFLVVLASRRRVKKALAVFTLIGLLPVAWYLKNAAMFGFFGSSSWLGMNLFNQVSYHILPQQMTHAGCDALVFDKGVFLYPSDYASYGFTATSFVPSLGNDDMHNVNIIAVSDVFFENSMRLIRNYPGHYVKNMAHAYCIFCKPSTQLYDLTEWAARVAPHVAVWEWLEGRFDFPWCAGVTNSVIFLPFTLVVVCLLLLYKKRRTGSRWRDVLRDNTLLLYVALMVSYTVAVSSMFELWENNRFKFPVEQFIWILALYSAFEVIRLSRDRAQRIGKGRFEGDHPGISH